MYALISQFMHPVSKQQTTRGAVSTDVVASPACLRRRHADTRRFANRLASIGVALALGSSLAAHAGEQPPAQLIPPNVQQVASLEASGVQIYACEFDDARNLMWVLQGPMAELYDADGELIIQHSAGPSWQAQDGSRIVGHVIAQSASDHPASIPQLLLATDGAENGYLASVRFVQRLDTIGGLPPGQRCSREHQTGRSPYMARYVFLK
jgi:hypothetical protein